jgi:flagellar basal-body rod protein FlgB
MFNSQIITALSKQLDATALNQRVIANNVANINTPGFKKSTVSFADQLKRAIGHKTPMLLTNNSRHIGGAISIQKVTPLTVQEKTTTMVYNQNNVDIDEEMVNLAANTILNDFSTDALNGKFSSLGYVIKGR